ncbi:MAG: acetyl-CoA carboxylase biotin carboxyl carrier protein [Mariprofundaceae bacterium]|nr:acetyl-CoA carboxylase biotin carboxyl carrier protein [Mariprofundaceae bacterium]
MLALVATLTTLHCALCLRIYSRINEPPNQQYIAKHAKEYHLNITEIRKLIKLIQSSDITEIEVSEGESSIRISRQGNVTPVALTAPQAAIAPAAVPVQKAETASNEGNDEHIVKSPMVGTFYLAPSPDSEPFVKEGDSIKKGETLCVIEAMKLMNEIEAEYTGTVDKILVDNATPLEYGQPIFVITPA